MLNKNERTMDIGNEGTDVFYGTLNAEPRNGLDRKVIQMAKQKAMELFEN